MYPECFDHGAALFVASVGVDAQLLYGVQAEVSHHAAFAGQFLHHLLLGVFARKADLHQPFGRQGAGTLGRQRPVAVECVVRVDHPAAAVGADRDAAAHVRDDEVRILITEPRFFAVQTRRGFLVEGMEDRAAGTFRQTADAGHVLHFVHHDGIGDVGLDTRHACDFVGDQTAEVRSVLHLSVDEVVAHGVVHFVNACGDGLDQSAAADDGRQLADVESLFGERFEDDLAAPRQLVGDVGVGCDLLGRMTQREVEQRTFVFEKCYLRGGGTRIYG